MGTGMRRLLAAIVILGVVGAAALWFASRGPTKPSLLVFGIDGAEWDMINPLIEQGRLPNLARLKREGVWAKLRSFEPILSPIIWTSIATGKTAEKHGIGWFMVQSEKTGKQLPVTSNVRKCKAFWNILTENQIKTGVLGWWASFPAEKIDGFIVSDFIAYHNFGVTGTGVKTQLGKTYPLELIEEIKPLLVDPEEIPVDLVERFANVTESEIKETQAKGYDFSNPLSHFLHILATAETYTAIGTKLYERERPRVFAVYYEGIDSAGHLFMKYADPAMPRLSEENRKRYSKLVEHYYEYQDQILGRYLALAGPDTTVIVVSDHGFKTGNERPLDGEQIPVGMAHHWHDLDGVFLMMGPGIKKGEEIPEPSVLDITPTLLYALDLPVADDMDGSVILDAFHVSHLREHPLKRIPTYEGDVTSRPSEVEVDQGIAQAMERHLQELGYVGPNSDDSSPQIHLNLASRHLDKGNLAEAERELKLALRMAPNDPQPHLLLAQIYRRENRLLEVKSELKNAMSLDPANLSVWMRYANICAELGHLDEAISTVEHVSATNTDWPGARVALGDLYNRAGRTDLAEAILRQALEAHPESVPAAFNLAMVLEKQERHEEALAAYQKVLALAPEHPYAHNNMGTILSGLGRDEEAKTHFEKSLEKDPENFEALYNLGTTSLQLGEAEKALQYLKNAVALKPDGLYVHKNLAIAYLKTGNPRRAFQEYLAMTRLYPGDFECWAQAARLLKRPEREADVIRLLAGAWLLDREKTRGLLAKDKAFDGLDPKAVEAAAGEAQPAEPGTMPAEPESKVKAAAGADLDEAGGKGGP